MDARVKPAHDDRTRVNASLILFVKMAACSAAIGRGSVADVVELPVSSSVAYA